MSQSTTITTGKVRFSFCNIFTAKAGQDGGEPKYSTAILIPKSDKETVRKIKAAIEAAKVAGTAKLGGKIPANLKQPLRDGDIEKEDDPNYAGHYFLNCNNKRKPGIVDRERNEILDPNEVYSGCYGRVNITFYAFNVPTQKGIACALNHVQKLEDGEALDGRVSVDEAFGDDFEDDLI